MKDTIELIESVSTSGDVSSVPDTCLSIQPEFRDPSYTKLVSDQVCISTQTTIFMLAMTTKQL